MKKSTKLTIGIVLVVAIICVVAVIVFAGIGKETSEYEKYIEASQKYVDELNYEKAIAELELAIEIEPSNEAAYIALAEIYVEMGDYETALSVLEEAKTKVVDITNITMILENLIEKIASSEIESESEGNIEEDNANQGRVETVYYDGEYDIFEYDGKGNRIKASRYNEDGSQLYETLYEYDEKNNCVKKSHYSPFGSINHIIEYDEKGNELKASYYHEDGSYTIDEFYENNDWKSSDYDKNGNLLCYETEVCDENGNRVKWSWYNGDGSLEGYRIFEYDENGNRKGFLDYDANGNLKY